MEREASMTVSNWLSDLTEEHQVTRKGLAVVHTLKTSPRLSSYGSIRDVAQKANVSIGTVTRTAQALRFAGWPALQEELRALYLTSLSVSEVAATRQVGQQRPSYASLARDRDNMNALIKSVDFDQLARVALMITTSRRTFVIAHGSFNGVGRILAHISSMYSYNVQLVSEEAQIANALATLQTDDLVVVINFWRLYESSYQAIQACEEHGTPVVLLTETVPRELEAQCTECIRIPAEGIGFNSSLTSATSVVHGILAEITALDPGRATSKIEKAEREWGRFGLMHRY
jgi:DNA-binding MurR/RpiR family transcriptional regulator